MPPLLMVPYILSGFTLSFGIVNLLNAWVDRKHPALQKESTSFWFGIISMVFSLYVLLQAAIMQSSDIPRTAFLLRLQGTTLSALFAMVPPFGASLGKRRRDWFDHVPIIAYGALALWSLASPAGYWFLRVDELVPASGAGPIVLNVPRGPLSPTYVASMILQYPLFVRQILDARRAFRAGDRTTGLLWGIGVLVILVASMYDKLVDFAVLPPPYMGEYPFPLLILTMGIRLSSKREEALVALQRSREEASAASARFREAFDASGDALFIHDAATGQIIETNRTMKEMYGYPLDGPSPTTIKDISAEDHEHAPEKAFERLAEARRAGRTRFHWMGRRKDGSLFPIEVTLKRMILSGRECILASVRESTDLEEALHELHREMAFNNAILDGLPGIFYLVDGEGRLAKWNAQLEQVTGLTASALKGRPFISLFSEEGAKRSAANLLAATLGFERSPATAEIPLPAKEGGPRPYFFTAMRMDTREGRMFVGVGLDLSDRVKAETAARESAERLRAAQRLEAVGQLAAGVAHDFNNLLAPIMGYASLLLAAEPLQDRVKDGLTQILSAAERAKALTGQLLALSRSRATEIKPVEVNAHVKGMESLLRSVLKENRPYEFHPCDQEAWILADRSLLEQAVVNLAVNARDAMPDGGTFRLSTAIHQADRGFLERHPDCVPGPYLLIEARDTGMGMDEKTKERIFEPFFTTKDEGKGTGLGLATVMSLVSMQGGAVEVESELGKGSSFILYLPLCPPPERSETTATKATSVVEPGALILLAEDDRAVRDFVAATLESGGYKVITAEDPEEALRLAEADPGVRPRLLVTDILMPRMDGRDLADALAKKYPSLPALFISGYAENPPGSRHRAIPEGHILRKPFTVDQLLSAVGAALRGRAREPERPGA